MQDERIIFKCEEKYFIYKRGWVITGIVLEGPIHTGAEMALVDNNGNIIQIGIVVGIEKERKLIDEVCQGDICGLMFKDFQLNTIDVYGEYLFGRNITKKLFSKSINFKEWIDVNSKKMIEKLEIQKEDIEMECVEQETKQCLYEETEIMVIQEDDMVSVEELLEELNNMTGLSSVKKDVNSLVNLLKIKKLRESRGIKSSAMSLHLVFYGNPGTGKTTVARLLARIYKKLEVVSKGHFVEVDRSGLVAGFIGQTALKVKNVVEEALGGILFIDEAYSLVSSENDNDSFGKEAIDTLLKEMEDHRDVLIVIVAGYTEPMEMFLNSNPGLRSRFNKFLIFEDYSPEELVDIFKSMCEKEGYLLGDGCDNFLQIYFTNIYNERDNTFANGRMVRNYFEKAKVRQANRLVLKGDLSDDELMTLVISDLKEE